MLLGEDEIKNYKFSSSVAEKSEAVLNKNTTVVAAAVVKDSCTTFNSNPCSHGCKHFIQSKIECSSKDATAAVVAIKDASNANINSHPTLHAFTTAADEDTTVTFALKDADTTFNSNQRLEVTVKDATASSNPKLDVAGMDVTTAAAVKDAATTTDDTMKQHTDDRFYETAHYIQLKKNLYSCKQAAHN